MYVFSLIQNAEKVMNFREIIGRLLLILNVPCVLTCLAFIFMLTLMFWITADIINKLSEYR